MEAGQVYSETFTLTQEDVNTFARITGDNNPIHIDPVYAETTPFKKPIIHGILSTGIISKILGMKFPGEGTVYLSQQISFKRPMYVETEYEATLTVLDVNKDKHQAKIETKIIDKTTNKINLTGEAWIMNKLKI